MHYVMGFDDELAIEIQIDIMEVSFNLSLDEVL